MLLVVSIWFGLFAQVIHSNGENQAIFIFLSVPFAIVALLIYIVDRSWRSHRLQREQRPHRDLAELMRRDPPS
jgi:hypothetical protein